MGDVVLDRLPENRVGLFMRMHHAMADGMAALATIKRFLDTTGDVLPDPQAVDTGPDAHRV